MKKKQVLSIVIWLLIFGLIFLLLQRILIPKWDDGLAATTDIEGFYAEEKDSLDVVFFGTSHVICGISPMKLYEDYGIKSYVLATGDQPMQSTYYWIKEAHKRQPHMVAVLDIWSLLFTDQVTEEVIRESLDDMPFSPNKALAIRTVCDCYNLPSFDFFFPLFHYHDRITELEKKDVTDLFRDKKNLWEGHYPIAWWGHSDYQGVNLDPNFPTELTASIPMEENNILWLQNIIHYCAKEQIPLILTKVPLLTWDQARHDAVEQVLAAEGIPFFDMNLNPYYQTLGMDPTYDYQGQDHLNMLGAQKVTDAFGQYLLEAGYVTEKTLAETAHANDAWNRQIPAYEHSYKGYALPMVEEIPAFLQAITDDPDYIVFYGYQDNGTPEFTPEYAHAISAFGFDEQSLLTRSTKQVRIVYNGEEVLNDATDEEMLHVTGELKKGTAPFGKRLKETLHYDFALNAWDKAMVINGKECTTALATGLHVIVYSMSEQANVCEVCFTPVANGDVYWQIRDYVR